MEKVWEELKKIEEQAQQILGEAQNKSKELIELSKQEAEKLLVNGRLYAEEEAQHFYDTTIEEAKRSRKEKLEANQKDTEKLKAQAEKRLQRASSAVMKAVLGENKP